MSNTFADEFSLIKKDRHWSGRFRAMASPCEILIETENESLASELLTIARNEALRIEQKFSRYKPDNIIAQINHAAGKPIALDDETRLVIDYADLCYQLSEGLFDITSGVLRRAWVFDGSDKIPAQHLIDEILPLVGWHKASLRENQLQLLPGMEIDLGGIGKEYAVDRVLHLLKQQTDSPLLVNFGGDLAVSGPQSHQQAWQVGIETPDAPDRAQQILEISAGALATSGDAKRFLLHQGKRYGHILNPKTGYPIENAPRSVTVAGSSCVQAGSLATLAILQGKNAEDFLREQNCIFWCLR
jgi:FAD:protein FMN transferase